MHLIYLDESGNTGCNLNDPQQPVFVLGALIVPERDWRNLEQDMERIVAPLAAASGVEDFEIHASEIRNGSGFFRGVSVDERLALRDSLLDLPIKYKLPFVFRAISKKRFGKWVEETWGKGAVSINPHLAAFPLVAQIVNAYLRSLGGGILGIFIMDENREVLKDIERSVKLLRADPGILQLDRIIEKGFFIDSRKSPILQLADLLTFQARKAEESRLGLPTKSIDEGGIERMQAIVHRGDEAFADVIRWLEDQQKK